MFNKSEPKLYYRNYALNKRVNAYTLTNLDNKKYPIKYVNDYIDQIATIVKPYVINFKNISFCLSIRILIKEKKSRNLIKVYYSSKVYNILNVSEVEDIIHNCFIELQYKVEDDIKTKSNQ